MATGIPNILKQRKFKKYPLQFRADGTFRILQMTDLHLSDPEMDDDPDKAKLLEKETYTYRGMEMCIEQTDPDLVVLTGDILNSHWDEMTYDFMARIVRKISAVFEKYNVPFAVVFGNHDSNLRLHREIQMCLFLESPLCYGSLNGGEMSGCGTYNLPILSKDGTRKAFNLWLFDSNDYPTDENGEILPGFDHVHADQIAWYEQTAAALRAENGGVPLPAILFQHIPVQQEWDLLTVADAPVPDTVGFTDKTGVYRYFPHPIAGRMRERPTPPAGEHREQFESWKKTGDILAAFFGHDHRNDFVVEKDGILLVQTLCSGFFTYGIERGGREIILHEDDPKHIETRSVESIADPKYYR